MLCLMQLREELLARKPVGVLVEIVRSTPRQLLRRTSSSSLAFIAHVPSLLRVSLEKHRALSLSLCWLSLSHSLSLSLYSSARLSLSAFFYGGSSTSYTNLDIFAYCSMDLYCSQSRFTFWITTQQKGLWVVKPIFSSKIMQKTTTNTVQ